MKTTSKEELEKSIIDDLSNVKLFIKDLREKLIEVSLLLENMKYLEHNSHIDRQKAMNILLQLLDMTKDDLRILYDKKYI